MRCDGGTVTLPRLGTLKTHEPTGKLAALVRDGSARILSATVSRTAQRWFVSFTAEVERDVPGAACAARHGGGDRPWCQDPAHGRGRYRAGDRGSRPEAAAFGAAAAAAHVPCPLPHGEGIEPPRKATARLARIHARAASVREDALHKATTALAKRYETVVVEDLNVTGMISNRSLARAVSDQGFGAARRMLDYKTQRNGGTLIVADRWYPSSKTCSSCGSVKAKLTLKDRIYACDSCGHTQDRDVNAARNLLSLAASGAESLNARRAEVRPGPAGHTVMKREPGTANAGQTGTAAPQGTAAA